MPYGNLSKKFTFEECADLKLDIIAITAIIDMKLEAQETARVQKKTT